MFAFESRVKEKRKTKFYPYATSLRVPSRNISCHSYYIMYLIFFFDGILANIFDADVNTQRRQKILFTYDILFLLFLCRFVIEENINGSTSTSLFAIFDGHGGEYAAEFAKDILVQNLYNKIIESKQILKVKNIDSDDAAEKSDLNCEEKKSEDTTSVTLQRKPSGRKAVVSKTDDDSKNSIDSDILDQLKPKKGFSFFKQTASAETAPPPKSFDAKCYLRKGNKIDYGKMITDEVLFADYKLVESAKKSSNVAGTTALIAIIDSTKLTVANVGDSRGVMCDHKGKTIPLSFDHKPQSAKEHKRIQEAGGFIAFKGVWRVSGILATSRALGDYPLKPNLVIANPDILEFELADHK
jgi:protein phosphatase 1L